MDELHQLAKKLADKYGRDADLFISVWEEMLKKAPPNEKGSLSLDMGVVLHELSYLNLTLVVWEKALEYCIKNNEWELTSSC